MRALILGGYGQYGARIARALTDDADLAVIVGGRDIQKCRVAAKMLGGDTEGLAVDAKSSELSHVLCANSIDVVVHAAGPFQKQDYSVARASAEAGCHYIDLADGRRFVCDFSEAMNDTFLNAGRVGVTGASTLPALSTAVVDRLTEGWQSVETIDTSIAPAQREVRGRATLEAFLDYCGAPVKTFLDGEWRDVRGWGQRTPVTFSRLPKRKGAACDVPDLEIFPTRYGVSERVMSQAALEVGATQDGMVFLAWLKAQGLIKSPAAWAGLLARRAHWFDRFGTDVGGMTVRVRGRDHRGTPAALGWHLTSIDGHGPEVPCIAAIELVRSLSRRDGPAPGAHVCAGLVPFESFSSHFKRWGMTMDVHDEFPVSTLKAAWLR